MKGLLLFKTLICYCLALLLVKKQSKRRSKGSKIFQKGGLTKSWVYSCTFRDLSIKAVDWVGSLVPLHYVNYLTV